MFAFSSAAPTDLSTSGHIGAFYFGADYTNIIATYDIPTLTFTPIGSAGTGAWGDIPTLNISVPNIVVQANKCIWADFTSDVTYGGSPLVVNFSAIDYEPDDSCSACYEVSAFQWYFDYGNSPTEYVTCAYPSDTAQHTYCGYFGQQYDVKLCVVYDYVCE